MSSTQQKHSIVGKPYEKGSFIHMKWISPFKFNIALVEDTAIGKEVVLKLHDVKHDYENELGFLKYLNNSIARRFVVDLKGATEPSERSREVRYGIAMEVLGENLHDYLGQNPELNTHARVALALNLVEAVDAIHRAGVAHCDLKPHQVCLTKGIGLKLVDFDSARYMNELFSPLDRFTKMYAAPEVVRAAEAGELSSFAPTKAIDLWPLGLILAQIFHPDLEPIFRNDEEAEVLQGGDPMAFIEERINDLKKSHRQSVQLLLKFSANERKSASVVLNENVFRTGAFTMLSDLKGGQEELLAGQAKLQKAIEATQRMIVEYGDTAIPRVVMLVPVDLANSQANLKDFFYRLASDSGLVNHYDLYFVCEGCTLFPSTECSCGKELDNPVRVKMPGDTLKKLTPALKAAAILYTTVSAASNIAGIRLPLNLPGVIDIFEFAGAVNEFAAVTDGVVTASGIRASGPAYAALADLLARCGVTPTDNICQGLHKVTDRKDGKVYWVCEAHAKAHIDRLLNANTTNYEQEVGTCLPALPKKGGSVATVPATDIADSLVRAKRKMSAQQIGISKHWAEGNFSAATQQISEHVKALDAFARVSNEWAQLAVKAVTEAKEAATKGFRGRPKTELNDKGIAKLCQRECGRSFAMTNFGFDKHHCRSCGLVVCANCSPPPRLKVEGYAALERVCKNCVEALDLKIQELDAAAKEAAAQSTTARENAQRAKNDKLGNISPSDFNDASLFLDQARSVAIAENEFDLAAALNRKLTKVRDLDSQRNGILDELARALEAKEMSRYNELDATLKALPVVTLSVAIALDAFPVHTIVRASVAGAYGVAAGTAGEVIGHSPSGEVIVRFKDGEEAAFGLASLNAVADLPNGWAIDQVCFSIADMPGKAVIGQPGNILGWSKPFDRDEIRAKFGGREVNVLLSQIETVEQQKLKAETKAAQQVEESSKQEAVVAATKDIWAAASNGYEDLVRKFVAQGANVDGWKDEDGQSALMCASQHGHTGIVKLLLDAGANTKAMTNSGNTALSLANGHKDITALLNPSSLAKELCDNACSGKEYLVKKCIANGANVDGYRDANGYTALILASYKGHTAIVQLLIEAGADKEAKNEDGFTALLSASLNGHTATVQVLVDAGADKNAKNKSGNSALMYASAHGHTATVYLLLEAGADKEAKDQNGKTALDFAKGQKHNEVVALLIE